MFNGIRNTWHHLNSKLRTPQPALPTPGLYHYVRETEGELSRIHLRVDPGSDGPHGVLMVNASRVLQLNPTATLMAYLALEGKPSEQAVKLFTETYKLSQTEALYDYTQFTLQLDELVRPDGACPIHDLNLEVTAPFSARPTAPYRMDLALTYRCNNDCAHCYNARPRHYPELSTGQWKQILDRLWEVGIPHIVFTGGEPTLRDDLPELVAHAEHNGQITGLNTNARRLSDQGFLDRLLAPGLDHIQVTLESHDPSIHDRMVGGNSPSHGAWKQTVAGLRNALGSRLFVMTNTTLLQHNAPTLAQTLEFTAEMGVPTLGLNALIYSGRGASVGTGLKEDELTPLLELARRHTEKTGQRLIWYTPTEYCHFDPMQLELGVKGCSAALYNMCVEPDGKVIPCQSYYQPIGDLLHDPWDAIWNHRLAVRLRERQGLPGKCYGCALLPDCGGGCPLKFAGALPV